MPSNLSLFEEAIAFERSKRWDIKSLRTQRADAVITFVTRGCNCKRFEYSLLIAKVMALGDAREKVGTIVDAMRMIRKGTNCIAELLQEMTSQCSVNEILNSIRQEC